MVLDELLSYSNQRHNKNNAFSDYSFSITHYKILSCVLNRKTLLPDSFSQEFRCASNLLSHFVIDSKLQWGINYRKKIGLIKTLQARDTLTMVSETSWSFILRSFILRYSHHLSDPFLYSKQKLSKYKLQ